MRPVETFAADIGVLARPVTSDDRSAHHEAVVVLAPCGKLRGGGGRAIGQNRERTVLEAYYTIATREFSLHSRGDFYSIDPKSRAGSEVRHVEVAAIDGRRCPRLSSQTVGSLRGILFVEERSVHRSLRVSGYRYPLRIAVKVGKTCLAVLHAIKRLPTPIGIGKHRGIFGLAQCIRRNDEECKQQRKAEIENRWFHFYSCLALFSGQS